MSFSRHRQGQSGPPPAARGEGWRTPNAVTVMKDDRLSLNRRGDWEYPSHLFVCFLKDGRGAYLPESKVEEEFKEKTGKLVLEQVFAKGDEIYFIEPMVRLAITGVTQNSTLRFQLNGYEVTYTWEATFGTSDQQRAIDIRDFIHKDPYLGSHLMVTNREAELYIFAKDTEANYNLIITASAGAVTKTPTQGMAPLTKIGKIASIGRDGTVTLEQAVPFPVPVGVNVGVPVARIIGYHPHAENWMHADSKALTAIEQASIYVKDMPHWREGIRINHLSNLRPDTSFIPAFN